MKIALRLSLLTLTSALVWGCDGEAVLSGSEPPDEGRPFDPRPGEGPTPKVAVRLTEAAPVIRPGAEAEAIPQAITLSFPVPMAPKDRSVDGVKARLTPGGVGFLEWVSERTLKIAPAAPLPPSAEIRLEIDVLRTLGGLTEGPGITHVFRTPGFSLIDARLAKADPAASQADLELAFSGPVALEDVAGRLSVELGGRPAQEVQVRETQTSPGVVGVRVKDRLIRDGVPLDIELDAGVRMRDHLQTQAGSARREVPTLATNDRKVDIYHATLEEGSEGWFLRIVCSDEASGRANHGHWENSIRRHFRTSPRCVLTDESVAASVRTEPKVDLRVSGTRAGFRLLGQLPRGPLQLTIEAGARTVDGGVVRDRFQTHVEVSRRTPKLAFGVKGRYVPRSRLGGIPVQALNVHRGKLRVDRVRPENLAFWATGAEPTSVRTADLLEVSDVELGGPVDVSTLHSVDLSKYLGSDLRGLFELTLKEVVPEGEKSRSAASTVLRVVATDLDIVAKRTRTGVQAWVIHTESLAPQSGAELRLMQPSGLVRATCQTAADGGCFLPLGETTEGQLAPPPPFGLVAVQGDDLAYLDFDEVRTPTGEADVGGASAESGPRTPYRAAAWTDRGVYRPGETAHFVAALWGLEHRAPKAGLPVELRLIGPRGTEVERVLLDTRAVGTVARDFAFAPSARTGRYRVEIRVGDVLLATETISVEAFVPERMKVRLAPVVPRVGPEASAQFGVGAQWLFGGSAEGSRVEMRCWLSPTRPRYEAFAEYAFGVHHWTSPDDRNLGVVTGRLDKDGQSVLSCPPLDRRGRALGGGVVSVDTAVFEGEGGRASRAQSKAFALATAQQIGLKADRKKLEVGEPFLISGVLLSERGALLSDEGGAVSIELFRAEREVDWHYDDEARHWTYNEHFRLASEGRIEANLSHGRFQARMTPGTSSGNYLIRVIGADTTSELALSGSGSDWGWWYSERSQDRTPSPEAPASVVLDIPGEIQRGQRAEVTARVPFAGRVLFTVETDRLHLSEWHEVKSPGLLKLSFTVDDLVPNAYVSVLAIKDPLEGNGDGAAFVPARGLGVASVKVTPDALTLPLTIRAPETIRSQQPLEVEIQAGPDAEVYVAAVDEGILSLTGFKTPDPLSELFAKRALEVDTFDTVGWNLLMPAGTPGGRSGGDAAAAPGAVMPVEPVAIWSGRVMSGPDGKAKVRFQVPEYRGALRVMAVALTSEKVGRAQAAVVVQDPIVVEPTVPRALTEGDTVDIPVLLTNLSGVAQTIRLAMTPRVLGPEKGGLDAGVDPTELLNWPQEPRTVRLNDGARTTEWFKVETKALVGALKIRFLAQAGDITTSAAQTVLLRSQQGRQRATVLWRAEGRQVDVSKRLPKWRKGSSVTQVVVTRNPFARSTQHLEYLIRYPYGCAEQTTSKLRALMVIDRFLTPSDQTKSRLKMIEAGIARLMSMQTPSGGFAFWPGRTNVQSWATAYVLDTLIDARKTGFEVSDSAIERGLRWAAELVERRPDDYAVPYLHFVLAKAGRARHGEIQAVGERLERRRLNAGYRRELAFFLLAAKHLGGDHRGAAELKGFTEAWSEPARRDYEWSMYSARRRQALELAILVELFGEEAWLRSPLEELAGALESSSYHYTTQELAWTMTALGRYVGDTGEVLPPVRLRVGGAELAPVPGPRGEHLKTWTVVRAGEQVPISLEVDAAVEGGARPFVLLLSEGVPTSDESRRSGGTGLSVTRRLVNASGELLGNNEAKLGELLYSVVTVKNTGRRTLRDLALVDLVPAGMEVVRDSGQGSTPSWLVGSTPWSYQHRDLLDDRIEVFGALLPGRSYVVWTALRAVSQGSFYHPAVTFEAMYDPSKWSEYPAGRVSVRR